jgi:segregation and condensation protein B
MSDKRSKAVDADLIAPAVGAMIFASDDPVLPQEIADALGGVELQEVEQVVARLIESFETNGCGLRLERIAGGYRLATRPDVGEWVRNFIQQRNRARLTPASLETLAIVAYRQPVTAPEVQAIRGKDSSASLKTLLDKKLLRILGKKKVVGRPLLYGTSKHFLVHFGLDSLGDLPSIEAFDEFVGALEGAQPGFFDIPAEDAECEQRALDEQERDGEAQ